MPEKKPAKQPHEKMIDDVVKVFKKHKIPAAVTVKPKAIAGLNCPQGQSPHEISVTLPNGKTVTQLVCM